MQRYLLILLLLFVALPAQPQEMGEDDFRISFAGPDGDSDYDASGSAVVYNPFADEFLVAWSANGDTDGMIQGETEVFIQRISAATGLALLPSPSRITEMGGLGIEGFHVSSPVVAFNAIDREYLVLWSGRNTVAEGVEIYGQRLDEFGARRGPSFQVTTMGGLFNPTYTARNPAVVHNPLLNRYFVVWQGDDNEGQLVAGKDVIFGRWLSNLGTAGGPTTRISFVGADDDAAADSYHPAVVFDFPSQAYWIAWRGTDPAIGGQLLLQKVEFGGDLAGSVIELTEPGSIFWHPSLSLTPDGSVLLVATDGAAESGGYEIFAQRVDTATGVADAPFQVSDMGGADNPDFDAEYPSAVYLTHQQTFLVAFSAEHNEDGQIDEEWEIFLQQVPLDGEVSTSTQQRISAAGGLGTFRGAYSPQLAVREDFALLAVWDADPDQAGEREIYGQRLFFAPPLFSDGFESGDLSAWAAATGSGGS